MLSNGECRASGDINFKLETKTSQKLVMSGTLPRVVVKK
jgi:hypothetical protein